MTTQIEYPDFIPNELIFKGLRRLITNEANFASITMPSELDAYLAEHPEENFLLRTAIEAYALTHGLRLVDDKLISASIREGRAAEVRRKARGWCARVGRAVLNLDKKETTALIREHEQLASEVAALETRRVKLEHENSELGKEAGTILEKARSEAKEITMDAGSRAERMLKDALSHIEATHKEKTLEIENLDKKLAALREEIEIKQALIIELSQNPDIVKEWECRRAEKRKLETMPSEKIREIMGDHLITLEDAEKHLGFQFTAEQRETLSVIPWSEDDLQECVGTHILFPGFPMNILDIRNKAPQSTFYSYKDAWYNDQKFANEKKVACRWYLLRKNIVPDSTSKNFSEQQVLLSDKDEVPRACELVYMMTLYYLVRGQKLFADKWARCIDLTSGSNRVHVNFYDDRLVIDGWGDDSRHVNLGVASSRKFRNRN